MAPGEFWCSACAAETVSATTSTVASSTLGRGGPPRIGFVASNSATIGWHAGRAARSRVHTRSCGDARGVPEGRTPAGAVPRAGSGPPLPTAARPAYGRPVAPRLTRAVVQNGPRALELRELAVPDIDDDSALLRVEACGICGSDAEQYAGVLPVRFPLIPGHEPLGVIERIGDRAARRWGVDVGDRVAVESLIPCGHCRACTEGRYQLCRGRGGMFGHGYVPLTHPPGLWGAYADYMYLDPFSLVHPMRKDVPATLAVMFNPLGAGFRWAVEIPDTGPGDAVLVLGPGQRGLACVIAARAAGADTIIVTGLARDAKKLALARTLGADHTIDVEAEDVRARVRELTGGRGADVVVEVSANAPEPVGEALHYVAAGGRIVLAGVKGFKAVPDFVSDLVVVKEVTIRGAFGVTTRAYDAAIRLIESGRVPLARMHTHDFPLEAAERAIRTLAGEVPGETSIHSCLLLE
ncbi:MAG: zinc-binding dehydrogenase [Deltaproteobacteria bacterium]|nr:MAG: zinc-binding dehydrogenase [Deltaproteobacteria bacterium]TMA63216.1 MAG: zinc-binding dehydrogenase [Deltaproteobacteria bacterium]TMA71118.1 MAG: zinc-binding dehydrogenase [Deltaproteobacteria bacterium]TMB38509.1 MAG: zinc-binding dehydrogenase [Deltaproteobacteria bacterium]